MSTEHEVVTAQNFTRREREAKRSGAVALLKRFLFAVPMFKIVLFPTILLIASASFFPQVFLYFVGRYVDCGETTIGCPVQVFDYSIDITVAMISLAAFLTVLTRLLSWVVYEIPCQWSMQDMHRQLMGGLAHTRVTYFDEHPSGRILNRVDGDFGELRDRGVVRVGDLAMGIVEVLAIGVVVFFSTWWSIFLVIPALALLFYLQYINAPMARRASTLVSIRRGELLHRETDLIEGTQIFAIYGKERALGERLAEAMRHYGNFYLLRVQVEAWGRNWILNLSTVYCGLSYLAIALTIHSGHISVVVGAVLISVVSNASPTFNWLSWTSMYLNSTLGHAQRVFEIMDLPSEESEEREQGVVVTPAHTTLKSTPCTSCPNEPQEILFENFVMSYRKDTPPILHGLSLRIPAKLKVGIVGRTGAGKSSIMQSLFRMVYVRDGDIKIGGRSLYDFEITEARSFFGVVPQDPYLFEGTVRSNLDPYHLASSTALSDALTQAAFPYPLDMPIVEGGKNLSLGERQLLCLARILLSKAQCIIMDEPTSGIDPIADFKIQEVLRHAFKEKSVITIAHRIDTLERYDRIFELKGGKLIWEGTPAEYAHR